MLIRTFLGHRRIYEFGLYQRIYAAVQEVIKLDEDEFVFFTDGIGAACWEKGIRQSFVCIHA